MTFDWLLTGLMVIQIVCFQLCAVPSIVRMMRRHSSEDLSIWREVLIALGCLCQLALMGLTGADWRVLVSPLASLASVLVMGGVILGYRQQRARHLSRNA